jgi:hypothetical protein
MEIAKWFPNDNSRKLCLMPGIMKLHMGIDHNWQMTLIDFQVTKSKVTVKRDSKVVYWK